ncbi:MFS transporter, partial [Loigolactobacillus coryniformis]|uniref:MFS transporter n=1 Tax=Loigolactobacillus coryniformis TaxID=1610 RepID=UPI0002193BF8
MQQRLSRATVLSIIATGLLSFMGTLVETSLNVTFATLTKQMQVNLATIQWLTTGYLLLTTLTMIASAHLIKRYPVKMLFLIAITCFTLGDLLSAVAPSFPIILLGRLIQAFSTGLSIPLMFHIILTSVPPRRLATYNGMAAMLIALGPALGPTYGGLLTATWSWRIFFGYC